MRHAVLVMAHGNLKVLTICMRILDSELFEFYIHIDAKTNVDTNCLLKICKHSKVFITKRIPVYWGDFTQIEAELLLLKNAVKGNYDYYHLISGADLPIKTSTQINNFFERAKNSVIKKSKCTDCDIRFACNAAKCGFKNYLSTGFLNKPSDVICKMEKILYKHEYLVISKLYKMRSKRLINNIKLAEKYGLQLSKIIIEIMGEEN